MPTTHRVIRCSMHSKSPTNEALVGPLRDGHLIVYAFALLEKGANSPDRRTVRLDLLPSSSPPPPSLRLIHPPTSSPSPPLLLLLSHSSPPSPPPHLLPTSLPSRSRRTVRRPGELAPFSYFLWSRRRGGNEESRVDQNLWRVVDGCLVEVNFGHIDHRSFFDFPVGARIREGDSLDRVRGIACRRP